MDNNINNGVINKKRQHKNTTTVLNKVSNKIGTRRTIQNICNQLSTYINYITLNFKLICYQNVFKILKELIQCVWILGSPTGKYISLQQKT